MKNVLELFCAPVGLSATISIVKVSRYPRGRRLHFGAEKVAPRMGLDRPVSRYALAMTGPVVDKPARTRKRTATLRSQESSV